MVVDSKQLISDIVLDTNNKMHKQCKFCGKSPTLLWNGDDNLKKDKIITIRVSEKEKKKLIEKSEVAKLSLSEYLIKQGLDKEIVIVDGLNEVVSELRRIGNNINQLTYFATSGRIYTA